MYKEPSTYTHSQIEKITQSNNISDICDMLVGVSYNEPDPDYAYNLVCKYLKYSDIKVVGLAILCVAHIARVHGFIPVDSTEQLFSNLINGTFARNQEIMGRIGDAVGDFSVFAPEVYDKLIRAFPDYFKELGF